MSLPAPTDWPIASNLGFHLGELPITDAVIVEAPLASTLAELQLGEAGQPFVRELEKASGILRRGRRQAALSRLWDDVIGGEKCAEFTAAQLRIADTMIRAALASPHDPRAGRRHGPTTTAGRVYEVAVGLSPIHVRDAVAADLRRRAVELASIPADNAAMCAAWEISHLDRAKRIDVIARRITVDAGTLAANYCSKFVGKGQGRPGWEKVARRLMAEWRDLPNLRGYLVNAAASDNLAAAAKSYAVKKSKRKKRPLAD
jgi:hypothetical protein